MKTQWRILFGAIILGILFYVLKQINLLAVYNILKTISPKFFLLAFVSYTLGILIFSLRGMIAVRDFTEHNFWFFLRTTLAGSFINVITPGSNVGGEPIRAYFLAKRYNKKKSRVFGAVLADRIIHGAASLFFIIASLLFILTYIPVSEELRTIFQTILIGLLLFLAFILFLNLKKTRFNFTKILKKIGIFKKIKKVKGIKHLGEGIENFTTSFKKTIFDKKTLWFGLLLSVICWLFNYASSYFLFLSLGISVSFFLVIIVVSLGSLVGDFSPTPGGMGFVEGFMIFLYSVVGINLSAAIVVSLLSRIIGYFFSLVLGGISLVYLEKEVG